MTRDNVVLVIQALFIAGIMGEWFYLVNLKVIKPEGLEMFLSGAGVGYLSHFFHMAGKEDKS